MRDLLMEIIVCLIAAAIIGFIIGWLFKHLFCRGKLAKLQASNTALESDVNKLRGQLSDRDASIARLESSSGASASSATSPAPSTPPPVAAPAAAPAAEPASPAPIASSSEDRPAWLMSNPSEGDPDDLKRIWGVGPVLEQTMNQLGIYYYRQVAKLNDQDISWVADNINAFPDRIKRDKWIEQARDLHQEKYNSEP